MSNIDPDTLDLTGKLLVAMPGMPDSRFTKSVVYICSHSDEGAMGLIINQLVPSIQFPDLLKQLKIEQSSSDEHIRVYQGGPVDGERGFVLHSSEYMINSTVVVDDDFSLTATVDVLRDLAQGVGPAKSILALGYSGWGPGQLDQEMRDNGWLSVDSNPDIVFDFNIENKWNRALSQLGIDPNLLSVEAGTA